MLIFIGMGLWDEKDISVKGFEYAKKADEVYIEFYTSRMMGTDLERIENLIGRRITVLERSDLEENSKKLIEKAISGDIAVLVPGDPMIATTHSVINLEARLRGVKVKIIHNASIFTAICGLTGLHNYRFGKSVSISYPHGNTVSKSPLNVIQENWSINAHTLLFLDLHPEPMSINEAIEILLQADEENILNGCYSVGVARAGSSNPVIRCDRLENLKKIDFGKPLHILIILSKKIHFTEYDCLKEFAGSPEELRYFVI
jgi:diphthine synthase